MYDHVLFTLTYLRNDILSSRLVEDIHQFAKCREDSRLAKVLGLSLPLHWPLTANLSWD